MRTLQIVGGNTLVVEDRVPYPRIACRVRLEQSDTDHFYVEYTDGSSRKEPYSTESLQRYKDLTDIFQEHLERKRKEGNLE
jgi:hypothetical protein